MTAGPHPRRQRTPYCPPHSWGRRGSAGVNDQLEVKTPKKLQSESRKLLIIKHPQKQNAFGDVFIIGHIYLFCTLISSGSYSFKVARYPFSHRAFSISFKISSLSAMTVW